MGKITRCNYFWVFVMQHAFAIVWGIVILAACLGVLGLALYTPSKIISERSAATDPVIIDDGTDQLFWFSQISDIHISKYFNWSTENFARYMNDVLPVVTPAFIISSGDLTDGFNGGGVFEPMQIEEEWRTYNQILGSHGLLNNTDFYTDIRGNHDDYSVSDYKAPENFYHRYSATGPKHAADEVVFPIEYNTTFGNYRMVMFDAAPNPGVIFNYVGELDQRLAGKLETELARGPAFNHTFLVGHYPTYTMESTPGTGTNIQNIAMNGHVTAYLVGHLHMTEQYARLGSANLLELELADVRNHSYHRIIAMDHDMFSIHDGVIGEWPIIMITNPKNAKFYSTQEPLHRIANSTHLRVLVFSPDNVTEVVAETNVNGGTRKRELTTMTQVGNSRLWTAPWNPSLYPEGLHNIVVTVRDAAGRVGRQEQQFSIDATPAAIPVNTATWLQHQDGPATWATVLSVLAGYALIYLVIIPQYIALILRKTGNWEEWRQRLMLMSMIEAGFGHRLEILLDAKEKLIENAIEDKIEPAEPLRTVDNATVGPNTTDADGQVVANPDVPAVDAPTENQRLTHRFVVALPPDGPPVDLGLRPNRSRAMQRDVNVAFGGDLGYNTFPRPQTANTQFKAQLKSLNMLDAELGFDARKSDLKAVFEPTNLLTWTTQMTMFRNSYLHKFHWISLLIAGIWIMAGPWFIGNVATVWGAVFVWGTAVQGRVVPLALQVGITWVWLIVWYIPLIHVCGWRKDAIWRNRIETAMLVAETEPDSSAVRTHTVRGIHLFFQRAYPFRIAWLCVLLLIIIGGMIAFNTVMIMFNPLAWLLSPFVFWYSLLVIAILLHLAFAKTQMLRLEKRATGSTIV